MASDRFTHGGYEVTQEELWQVLIQHRKWLYDEADAQRADLSSADLRGADLSSADLRGANLSSADLSSADLSSADLRGANLRGANLSSADLSSADLRGANLSSADLRGANLSSANLSSADLSSADLRGANLRGADLEGADLRSANLRSANLRGADLRSANLEGASLSNADLEGANLEGAIWCFDDQPLPIEKVADIRSKVLTAVEREGCSLNMQEWHTCETTHCLAGWITTIHPQGRLLEAFLGPSTAAAVILHHCGESIPDFYDTCTGCDERALTWLRTGQQVNPEPHTAERR